MEKGKTTVLRAPETLGVSLAVLKSNIRSYQNFLSQLASLTGKFLYLQAEADKSQLPTFFNSYGYVVFFVFLGGGGVGGANLQFLPTFAI